MKKPDKWTEVYPQGTKQGDEEAKFFKSLARHPKFEWRSVGQMVKESGLDRKRVEEIINKYLKKDMIIHSKSKEDHYAYWERVPELLKDDKTINAKDQENRINKQIDPTCADKVVYLSKDDVIDNLLGDAMVIYRTSRSPESLWESKICPVTGMVTYLPINSNQGKFKEIDSDGKSYTLKEILSEYGL